MYMDQAKGKLAEINGYKDSQKLCNHWCVKKECLKNIYYRNRGEDEVEQIFLAKVLMDSEIGSKISEFIRNHVPEKEIFYPTIDVWDMNGMVVDKQKGDFILESESWIVIIRRKKVPEMQPDKTVEYVITKQERWDMRIYSKGE